MFRALSLALILNASLGSSARADSLWERFSGERAFADVKKLVEIGPRPAGSEALEKARVYLRQQLEAAGWKVQAQTFTDRTPAGPVTFVNLLATFGDHSTPTFVLCSHYDTKLFRTFRFLGANDGGSSTGVLLELARVLSRDPALASRLQLVFFDGEEAIEDFNDVDGLYGSRYFAKNLPKPRTLRSGILFDMIGDKNLTVTLPPDSPAGLARGIFQAADELKLRDHFTYFDRNVTDDHVPLNAAGIVVIDLIDFDFPAWHTAGDDLDAISAESLGVIGKVTLRFLVEMK